MVQDGRWYTSSIAFNYNFYRIGGLQAIAELLQVDCEMYGLTNDHYSVTLRRYAGMALTNLTFGDVANKVYFEISFVHNFTFYNIILFLSQKSERVMVNPQGKFIEGARDSCDISLVGYNTSD